MNFKQHQLFSLSVALICQLLTESSHAQPGPFPFQNTSLPWEERVDDLVSRLTVEEMQWQMARGGNGINGGPAPAIPRLGIGPYRWDTECLRGDVLAPGNATAFPQAIGLAATFSPGLMYRVAQATGMEVRGKHNDFVQQNDFGMHTGASCFSPVINIARDPRWGRNQETYGEDPFLAGVMSEAFVTGLQGRDPRYVQATAGCKHFDAYAGPEDIPVSRFSFDAKVSDTDWHMTFLPAFRRCVLSGTFSLMCSYNSLNGVPACANEDLLTNVLRNEWGFKGYVVSDSSAIENIIKDHHYLNNSVDTAAACVKAGCNLELSPNLTTPVYASIVDAVKQGKLTEDILRERVKPLFYTRMRLGEFDPYERNPYAHLDGRVVESPEHRALAVEAAVSTFVLLKNDDNILPLKPETYKNVAVIGPMADNVEQLFGDYSPLQSRSYTKTPFQGIQELFPNAKTGKACQDGTPCTKYDSSTAKSVVDGADLIFMALGTGQAVESEGHDRKDLMLPGKQLQLGFDVMNANSSAKIIMLLFSAGPLNVSVFDWSPRVNAILELFFPAQATGDALVTVLTNREGRGSPAGRLPMTWPMLDTDVPDMVNYSMAGRTYRYSELYTVYYPFGYGLSYSRFRYDELDIIYHGGAQENLDGSLRLSNVGDVHAEEVIQCYIEWGDKSLPVPQRQLVYFERVFLRTREELRHLFRVEWQNWAFWKDGNWTVQAGPMTLFCGGQQPGQKKTAPSNVLSKPFTIQQTMTMSKL